MIREYTEIKGLKRGQEYVEFRSLWGNGSLEDDEYVRDAHISCSDVHLITVYNSLAIKAEFYNCVLIDCVLRDCTPAEMANCRFVNCIFEGCSPPTDGKFEGLTTVLDSSKEAFKFTLLPSELKEKIMSYAIWWDLLKGRAPLLIVALRNGKREKNRLETLDHELAVQTLSRERVYRFNIRKDKRYNFPAMRTIRHLHIYLSDPLTDAQPPNWQLFEQLETVALDISCFWDGPNHSAQCISNHKSILQGIMCLPELSKVLVSIAVLDMTTDHPDHNPPGEDQLKHIKCLLNQVISLFSERLEVPAAIVEGPAIHPGYMNWIWEAMRVEESYTPHSRLSTGRHTPLLKLRLISSPEF